MNSDGVAFLRADIERFCGELVDLAPAIRLRLVTELRAALDVVTTAALTSGMAAAEEEGRRLCRIARFTGVSHGQVRRLLATASSGSSAGGRGAVRRGRLQLPQRPGRASPGSAPLVGVVADGAVGESADARRCPMFAQIAHQGQRQPAPPRLHRR